MLHRFHKPSRTPGRLRCWVVELKALKVSIEFKSVTGDMVFGYLARIDYSLGGRVSSASGRHLVH